MSVHYAYSALRAGGPGGAGVDAILQRGVGFQKIIGEEYDIVSFDPRYVGNFSQ
jgi:hypothetical protein